MALPTSLLLLSVPGDHILPTNVAQQDPEAMMSCWAPMRQPTREDWELHRPTITKLYIDERKSLEEVRVIMANEHTFNANARAYKFRIKEWRLRRYDRRSNVACSQGSGRALSQSRLPTLHRLIAPPTSMLLSEKFFVTIRLYINLSVSDQTWISDRYGELISSRADSTPLMDPGNIVAQCPNVVAFFKQQSFNELGQALSQVFALIKYLLITEDPRTLECFLASFLYFTKLGMYELVTMLRGYISEMADTVLRDNHPWRDLCLLLGSLDSNDFQLLLDQAYHCVVNTFDQNLGSFHKRVVVARVDCIHSLFTRDDITGAERQLRTFLADCIKVLGPSDWRSQYIMVSLGWNLNKQHRYAEAEDIGLYALRCATPESNDPTTVVRRLEMIGDCQYHLHKQKPAEESIREAISVIQNTRGTTDPWAIENIMRIEGWLREWGREAEAICLKEDIKALIVLGNLNVD